jgi:hypothetical protein
MNEEVFNLSVRKFLKTFGVTAQREIEKAVDAGLRAGTVAGDAVLPARARLVIDGIDEEIVVEGEIRLE